MGIVWQYLDKRGAALSALRDYNNMKFIIEHTDEKIANLRSDMTSVGSPQLDGLPRTHNPEANESRMINAINEIDVLRERYRQAVEYMAWFKPAWKELSEDERFILTEFYLCGDENQCDAVASICNYCHIERSSAYNKKNRAVQHLAALLYGKQ